MPKLPIPGVKNLIAVGSGKGGVGKTTVSVNLAVVLASMGYKTGLMDADVYGPNVPLMMGINRTPMASRTQHIPLGARPGKAGSERSRHRPGPAEIGRASCRERVCLGV